MDDVASKLFLVLPQELRRCMVCGSVFPRLHAPAHNSVPCGPHHASNKRAPHPVTQDGGTWISSRSCPPTPWRNSFNSPAAAYWNSHAWGKSPLIRWETAAVAPTASASVKSAIGSSGGTYDA